LGEDGVKLKRKGGKEKNGKPRKSPEPKRSEVNEGWGGGGSYKKRRGVTGLGGGKEHKRQHGKNQVGGEVRRGTAKRLETQGGC